MLLHIPDGTGHTTVEVTDMREFEKALKDTPTALLFDKESKTQLDRNEALSAEEVIVVPQFQGG